MIFKRPWLVIVLLVIVLGFCLIFFLRFGSGLALWDFLGSLPLAVSPLYLVLTGLLWGMVGLVCAWLLWRGRRFAPAAVRSLALAFGLYYWIEQALVMDSPLRSSNWLFSAVVTLAGIGVVWVSLRHPALRAFYGGEHDQKEQD